MVKTMNLKQFLEKIMGFKYMFCVQPSEGGVYGRSGVPAVSHVMVAAKNVSAYVMWPNRMLVRLNVLAHPMKPETAIHTTAQVNSKH